MKEPESSFSECEFALLMELTQTGRNYVGLWKEKNLFAEFLSPTFTFCQVVRANDKCLAFPAPDPSQHLLLIEKK